MKLVVALSIALFAVSSFQAKADVYNRVSGQVGQDAYDENFVGPTPNGPLQGSVVTLGIGESNAYANVGLGVNRARATLKGTSSAPMDFGSAGADSGSFDTFTISDPALNGTQGSFTTRLYVQGSGQFEISPELRNNGDVRFSGGWEAGLVMQAQGVGVTQTAYFGGEWNKPYFADEIFYEGDQLNAYSADFEFTFVFGEPIDFENYLTTGFFTENLGDVGGVFDGTVDLGNSVYWGGITEVNDANGKPLGSYGFNSESGFDYRANALPEPTALSLCAFVAIGALNRRRRSIIA